MEQKGLSKTIVIGSIICSLVLLGVVGSYAYFTGSLGSNKNEEVSVQAGNLSLTFADGNSEITEALEFGGSIEKTFTIENTGTIDATARIMWDDLINTYLDGSLTYSLSASDTIDGIYTNIVENQNVPVTNTLTKQLLAGNLTIPTGTTKYYKLTITLKYLDDIDQTADLKASLSTHFSVEESDGKDLNLTIKQTLKRLNKTVKEEKTTFTSIATTDETQDGLFSMDDDYETSYYYRGAVTDNYVKFGTWKEGDNVGKPMYWRIIRINGDGSVRMIYDGTSAHANGEPSTDRLALTSVAWNTTNANDAKYVGYMYGGTNGTASTKRVNLGEAGYADSGNAIYNGTETNIKTQVEAWYNHNLSDLDEYVEDVVYCNDRSISETSKEWWVSEGTERGYGNKPTAYGAFPRVFKTASSTTWNTAHTPSLKCKDKNDSFTKEESDRGNGMLNEKVGLITIDEAVIAGAFADMANKNYYLYKGSGYWSLSSYFLKSENSLMFVVGSVGHMSNTYTSGRDGVAPVISLKASYFKSMKGTGKIGDEYRIE